MKRKIIGWLVAVSIVLTGIFISSQFRFLKTYGSSMVPTIQVGQYAMAKYDRTDPEKLSVVLIRHHNIWVIKRIIAVPGDPSPLDDPYWEQDTIPDDYYFVQGDNLNNSYDSRDFHFGLVHRNEIWGKIRFPKLTNQPIS